MSDDPFPFEFPYEPMTARTRRQAAPLSRRKLLVFAAIALLLVMGFIELRRAYREFFHAIYVGKTGPVPLRNDWPTALTNLLEEPEGIEIDESTIQVHALCRGAYDAEFVWRMDAVPGLLEYLEARWRLKPETNPKWRVLEGHGIVSSRAETPSWWSPKDDDDTTFYFGPSFLRKGEERTAIYQVAFDKKRNTIFVHYYDGL